MRSTNFTTTTTLLAAAIALGGCAASVNRSSADVGSGAAAVAPAVRVPAESASRIVLNLGGSPAVLQSKDWEAFKGAWRGAMQSEAATAGVALTVQDGAVRSTGQAGTLLAVQVNDYRYVSSGARFGLGIMTGNAYIDATVRFLDARTGQPFGPPQSINTSSSAWQGIFSAMTDKQLQAVAQGLVRDVKGR